jgi:hypothetical protein
LALCSKPFALVRIKSRPIPLTHHFRLKVRRRWTSVHGGFQHRASFRPPASASAISFSRRNRPEDVGMHVAAGRSCLHGCKATGRTVGVLYILNNNNNNNNACSFALVEPAAAGASIVLGFWLGGARRDAKMRRLPPPRWIDRNLIQRTAHGLSSTCLLF